ncbi:hypothetical protein [uncultured Dokdonia sp.]|uniref:hypothetical protein n=1 Tax=uncultured Dokdonia sp. TaxID=575653 RepID=UPI00260FA311|nr:hypothetical protein [uncultured Dokdonia sp.]
MKNLCLVLILIFYAKNLNAQLEEKYLNSIWSISHKLKLIEEKKEYKSIIIQLDTSVSSIKYYDKLITVHTNFNSGRRIHTNYTLLKDIVKISVTDSCDYDQMGFYDYLIQDGHAVYGGVTHSASCLTISKYALGEEWSEKYHYKSEDIQKFCLDLFDRIQVVKKTIFLD